MGHNYLDCISNEELERLISQHQAWLPETHGVLNESGFKQFTEIAVFGCGPGLTVYDLATSINPKASITGIDVSDYYLNYLNHRIKDESLTNISTKKYDLGKPIQESMNFDAAFCRWFLAWVTKDINQVLSNIYNSLKPGGVFVAMEYLTLKSTVHSPPCKSLPKYLDAWEKFYIDAGGTTEIGATLPQKFSEAGFKIKKMNCVGGYSGVNERYYGWWKRLFFLNIGATLKIPFL